MIYNVFVYDLETKSRCDLPKMGAAKYFADPSTEILCLCGATVRIDTDDPATLMALREPPKTILWTPGDDIPEEFYNERTWLGVYNVAFERQAERVLTERYGFPTSTIESYLCLSYLARCNNLPGNLAGNCRALGAFAQKNIAASNKLIKLLSIPQAGTGQFWEDTADPDLVDQAYQEMYDYCAEDVEASISAIGYQRWFTEREIDDLHVQMHINERGVPVDTEMARAAAGYADDEGEALRQEIEYLTDGACDKAKGENLKKWVTERINDEQIDLITKHKGGERVRSLDKTNRAKLLSLADLDPLVRDVLEVSDEAQSTSVSKFTAAANIAVEGRAYYTTYCREASASGRYSSKGLQVHNFARKCLPAVLAEEIRTDLIDQIMAEDIADYTGLTLLETLKGLLRPMICAADDHMLVGGDWSAIEGCVGPWLAKGQRGSAEKLKSIKAGVDQYLVAATAIYNREFTKDDPERQIGKVAELSLQFGGGANAFLGMGRNYGVQIEFSQADLIKKKWRVANPWAKKMWDGCERAVLSALRCPGEVYTIGRLKYFAAQNVLNKPVTVFCELPDGTLLTYPDVRTQTVEGKYGPTREITALRASWSPKQGDPEWPRGKLWGGLLFENAVQGTAASLLRDALFDCDQRGLPVIFHVHDEIVLESPVAQNDADASILTEVMNTAPDWAKGLPVRAEIDIKKRFSK